MAAVVEAAPVRPNPYALAILVGLNRKRDHRGAPVQVYSGPSSPTERSLNRARLAVDAKRPFLNRESRRAARRLVARMDRHAAKAEVPEVAEVDG